MVIILKDGYTGNQLNYLTGKLEKLGAKIDVSSGAKTVLTLTDADGVDEEVIRAYPFVESVVRSTKPYKLVKEHGKTSNDKKLFDARFIVIAGPCAVESERQISDTAAAVRRAGATMLRGGAFKPRTSPYSFQGLGKTGIDMLVRAGKLAGLPVVSEVTGTDELDFFADVDILQIGARNMQNYELLRAVGRCDKPVIIKRGFGNTIDEWLLSAEYVMSGGNDKIILCERGVRTIASANKAVIDFAAVRTAKNISGLPVIVDPSHASERAEDVIPLAVAAAAVGADGVMIETHICPEDALSDGGHQLTPVMLGATIEMIKHVLKGDFEYK